MSSARAAQNPDHKREDALAVVRRLRTAGHVAYFAGGCVRDLLLGATPKDYDVATDAPPQRVRELFSNTQAVGAAFGVILVRHRGSQIEVATFRTEAGYDDGRHPSQIQFTTAQNDARRRDFTINGLFFDPLTDQVIDYVGGQDDLKARRVRAIGAPKERFEEDSLRLLRAVRFSARLGFEIEPQTATAIADHAAQLKRISPERVAEELRIMLTPGTRLAAWRMLWELKLVDTLYRFLSFPRRARDTTRPYFFDRVAPGEAISFGLALAAAVVCYRMQVDSSLSEPRTLFSRSEVRGMVQSMRQALRISNEESEQMGGALAGLEPLLADAQPTVAQLKRFLMQPTSGPSRKLVDALDSLGIQSERARFLRARFNELEKTDYAPAPLIDGNVLSGLGLKPGPMFKRILDEVYDAQLEGRVRNPQEAIDLARKLGDSQ